MTLTEQEDAPLTALDGELTKAPCHDEEFSSLLGFEPSDAVDSGESVSLEEDCLPVDIVVDAVHASARAQGEALRTRSQELARDVLSRAEQEVRELMSQDLSDAERVERSRDIVARAQREVGQILAQGRNDAEVVEMRAGQRAADLLAQAEALSSEPEAETEASEPELEPEPEPEPDRRAREVLFAPRAIVESTSGTASDEPAFATLRATLVASADGHLRYRVTGALTLATMYAFEQAVSRLPGVTSASVEPEPDDVAILSLATSDPLLVPRLLVCMPGIQLDIEAA